MKILAIDLNEIQLNFAIGLFLQVPLKFDGGDEFFDVDGQVFNPVGDPSFIISTITENGYSIRETSNKEWECFYPGQDRILGETLEIAVARLFVQDNIGTEVNVPDYLLDKEQSEQVKTTKKFSVAFHYTVNVVVEAEDEDEAFSVASDSNFQVTAIPIGDEILDISLCNTEGSEPTVKEVTEIEWSSKFGHLN